MKVLIAATLIWLAPAAHASCDTTTKARDIAAHIADAEDAYGNLDEAAFSAAAEEVSESMPCVVDTLLPPLAADLHRLQALASFFDGDRTNTVLSFLSVRAIQPGYQLPEKFGPSGHPLRDAFEEATTYASGEVLPIPAPESGWILIDGKRAQHSPTDRPFLFQRFNGDAKVVDTKYVYVGAPVPDYPVDDSAPPPDPASTYTPPPNAYVPPPATSAWRGPSLESLDIRGRKVTFTLANGSSPTGKLVDLTSTGATLKTETGKILVPRDQIQHVVAEPTLRTGRLITGSIMSGVGLGVAGAALYYANLGTVEGDWGAIGLTAVAAGHLIPGVIMISTSRPDKSTRVDVKVALSPMIGPKANGFALAGTF